MELKNFSVKNFTFNIKFSKQISIKLIFILSEKFEISVRHKFFLLQTFL